MGRNKTQKFADNDARENVIQQGKEIYQKIKGNWNKLQFKNNNPIVVELACGRGEYTIGLAENIPDMNFIGVDIKGARIWKGSGIAIEKDLKNASFLRTHIQNLEDFFNEDEISELWIIHPDPRPKDSDERRRLTNNRFLDMYKKLVKPGGTIRLKTDNTGLFEYTIDALIQRSDIEIIDKTEDLYNDMVLLKEHFGIKTRYELEFSSQGHKIKYVKFQFLS